MKTTVNAPLRAAPSYALPEGAAPDELRAAAVRAQRDMLSVKWTPAQDFTYEKKSRVPGEYNFKKDQIYAGLPYTSSAAGLFHWLAYYDFETGLIDGMDFKTLGDNFGNSCASCVSWGWAAVCAKACIMATSQMVYANGCIPIGPCDYDRSIEGFHKLSTVQICADNGQEVMYQSYANVKAADGVVSSGKDSKVHARMAVEAAHVEYTDGVIDGEKSYLTLQEQSAKAGRPNSVPVEEDGQSLTYSGKINIQYTFATLFSNFYIPITTPEFLGTKAYQKPVVSYQAKAKDGTKEAVGTGSVQSSFRIVSVEARITGQNGRPAVSKKALIRIGYDIENRTEFSYPLSGLELSESLQTLSPGQSYHYEVKVLVSTGETFTPVAFDFTA